MEVELNTTTRSLELQICMYKQILAQQQQDKLKHVQELQNNYATEIERMLAEREEDSKTVELARKNYVIQLNGMSERNKELEQQLESSRAEQLRLKSLLSERER